MAPSSRAHFQAQLRDRRAHEDDTCEAAAFAEDHFAENAEILVFRQEYPLLGGRLFQERPIACLRETSAA